MSNILDDQQQGFVLTILARKLQPSALAEVFKLISQFGLSVVNIQQLTKPVVDDNPLARAALECHLQGLLDDLPKARAQLLELSVSLGIDIALQPTAAYNTQRRLACFDMDSTLIQAEVIDRLAEAAGIGEQVAEITEQAMQGKLDFTESFKRRMALLKGLDESVLSEIADALPITEGAERLLKNLKKLGYKTAIFSGGFTYFGEYLQSKLGIDYVYANQLDVVDGKVTGEVKGEVVDAKKKAELLKQLAEQEGLTLAQTVAVGDGANDLLMLAEAGLGVAFHAKPIVKESARYSIATLGLDGVLYYLGYSDDELADD
ncbi:phosphoserine phosphatase SerB [Reinekea thalattae]|uniref:phosphoserine phosphatase SerB n=1 Tax=Reinekea thalattae TaxID=2593301 RepID=UPI001C9CF5CB|nr:phosphoserine phosphatase SerB [Reinekea thalattae]